MLLRIRLNPQYFDELIIISTMIPLKNILIQKIEALTEANYEYLFALHRHYHANPELTMFEFNTAARQA